MSSQEAPDANVKNLNIKRVETAVRPDPGIVAAIEALLEDAKSGKVQGIAYAIVVADGHDPGAILNCGWRYGFMNSWNLGESITRLVLRYNDEVRRPK